MHVKEVLLELLVHKSSGNATAGCYIDVISQSTQTIRTHYYSRRDFYVVVTVKFCTLKYSKQIILI